MYSKRLLFIVLPLFIFALSCVAFKYTPPYGTFDHEQHNLIVERQGMDCFTCHRVDVNETDPIKRVEILRDMLRQSNDKRFMDVETTCHACHVNRDYRVEDATNECRACHTDLRGIMPDDHKGDFVNTHGLPAKEVWHDGGFRSSLEVSKLTNYPTCQSCHDQRFCVDCHSARDTAKRMMHPRTFRVSHVAAAYADPASCASCHSARFCGDCHAR